MNADHTHTHTSSKICCKYRPFCKNYFLGTQASQNRYLQRKIQWGKSAPVTIRREKVKLNWSVICCASNYNWKDVLPKRQLHLTP